MAGEINFLITVAILGVLAYLCQTRCSSNVGYQSSISKVLMFIGMGSVIIGMALYYTLGMYAITVFSPFLIVGMLLVGLAGCKARSDQNYIPPPAPKRVQPTDLIMRDPETLNQIAENARTRGMLIERQNPERPNEVFRSLRCPTCRYIFDIGKARVVGFTIYCPSCDSGLNLGT